MREPIDTQNKVIKDSTLPPRIDTTVTVTQAGVIAFQKHLQAASCSPVWIARKPSQPVPPGWLW